MPVNNTDLSSFSKANQVCADFTYLAILFTFIQHYAAEEIYFALEKCGDGILN